MGNEPKLCPKCGEPKTLTGKTVLRWRCKSCERERQQRPEVKARRRERQQRPEVKARRRESQQRPEVKARRRESQQRPEVKARRRERKQRPEVKARRRERKRERQRSRKVLAMTFAVSELIRTIQTQGADDAKPDDSNARLAE